MEKNEEDDVGDLGELLKPHFVKIQLSANEMLQGEKWGKKVWASNQRANRSDERSSEEADIAWVQSEIAVAQWLGVSYEDPDGKWTTVPDVAFVDVKWTAEVEHNVPLRKHHPNSRPVVSIVGIAPNFVLRGWEYSQHMKIWAKDISAKNKSSMYDKDNKLLFPWRRLKPMYLLSKDPSSYKICEACDGSGISVKKVPCTFCPLGKMLCQNMAAFNQLVRMMDGKMVAA